MDHKIIFRELLTDLKNAADKQSGVISKAEVHEILKNMPLEEEHFSFIYQYLSSLSIQVVDSKEEVLEQPELGGQKSLSLYIEELAGLTEPLSENEQRLMRDAMQGDEEAGQHLIESYLPLICEIAGSYEGTDVLPEDLIQEGNLGLLTAMKEIAGMESPAACRAHIVNCINRAMEQAIGQSQEKRQLDEGIVSRVNHLNEAVHNLERDLEHKVSAEELSAYLEMPLSEIRDLLRMSGDQIELEGNEKNQ